MDNGIHAVRAALDALRDSQAAADAALKAFEQQDVSRENAGLRDTVERLNAELAESRRETGALRQAYETLERDFKHELSSKRTAMLGLSERRQREYLADGLAKETERVQKLYNWLQASMTNITAELNEIDEAERRPLAAEAEDLRGRVAAQAARARALRRDTWANAAERQAEALRELDGAPIEDAALKAVRRFFRWEAFLGLKIISAVGALLLLLGVFTFGRYLYIRMGPALQCAAIFAFGLILMGAGEAFYRKKWRGGFARALTAGGSGVLFLGAALGYMTLDVLPMWAALGICAAASLLTFAAALRYNAQLVAAFALAGGFLPVIALESSIVLFASIYFVGLSVLALLIATRKNWRVARFIGLGAALISELALIGNLVEYAATDVYHHIPVIYIEHVAAVGALIGLTSLAYLIIPVFGAWFTKTRVRAADIVLLTGNVVFHFLIGLFWMDQVYRWMDYHYRERPFDWHALIPAFFAVCCIIMAIITERQKHSGVPESETGSLRALFFITAITFSALVAPYALKSAWFSIGWLAEAAGLLLYGIFRDRRRFRRAGTVIGLLCLFSFLLFNVIFRDSLFVWQYLSVTLAAAVIAAASLRQKPIGAVSVFLNGFRAAAAFNVWLYLVYALQDPLRPALRQWLDRSAGSFAALLAIALGFIFAFFLPRVRLIYNRGFHIAAFVVGTVSTMWLLGFNAGSRGLLSGGRAMEMVVFALYIAVNLTAIGWIQDFLRFLIGLKKFPPDILPLFVSGYAMLAAAQNLVVQLSLNASSLVLTLLFGLTAFGWVVFGFVRRNGVTRVSGLVLAFFAVAKLFVLDLRGLNTTWRIVSYFTGGAVLLAISFAYQWFNMRLKKAEAAPEEDRSLSE